MYLYFCYAIVEIGGSPNIVTISRNAISQLGLGFGNKIITASGIENFATTSIQTRYEIAQGEDNIVASRTRYRIDATGESSPRSGSIVATRIVFCPYSIKIDRFQTTIIGGSNIGNSARIDIITVDIFNRN